MGVKIKNMPTRKTLALLLASVFIAILVGLVSNLNQTQEESRVVNLEVVQVDPGYIATTIAGSILTNQKLPDKISEEYDLLSGVDSSSTREDVVQTVARKYQLNYQVLLDADSPYFSIKSLRSGLGQGKLYIAYFGYGRVTSNGTAVVIRAYDTKGNFYFIDPYAFDPDNPQKDSEIEKAWSEEILLSEVTALYEVWR